MSSKKKRASLSTGDHKKIIELQKQVASLTSENEKLRAILAEYNLLDAIEPKLNGDERRVLSNSISTKKVVPSKFAGKGCSCRGNCSTKVCGCVKKNAQCAESCKCNYKQCKNQDIDKENRSDVDRGERSSDENGQIARKSGQPSSKEYKMPTKSKRSTSERAGTKNTKHRSIFSPASLPGTSDFDIADFVNESLRFGENSLNRCDNDEVFVKSEEVTKKYEGSDFVNKRTRGKARNVVLVNDDCKPLRRKVPNKFMTLVETIKTPTNKMSNKEEEEEDTNKNAPEKMPRKASAKRDSSTNLSSVVASDNVVASANLRNISNSSMSQSSHSLEGDDFDPMKPRHVLPRSPLGVSYPRLDVSEIPLPIPQKSEEPLNEFLPPPEELNEAVVDWEKHQAERVFCRKCGRGFYAYRIKKHEASCQKV